MKTIEIFIATAAWRHVFAAVDRVNHRSAGNTLTVM
jgi:hypothetical protein